MTFLQHIAKVSELSAASSRTLGERGPAVREERRFSVAKPLHQVVPAGTLPVGNTPRIYLAGDPWRGSGLHS